MRAYTSNDGKNGAAFTLRVSNVQLFGSRPGGEGGEGADNLTVSRPVTMQVHQWLHRHLLLLTRQMICRFSMRNKILKGGLSAVLFLAIFGLSKSAS